MKKKLVSSLMSMALVAGLLAGCGSGAATETSEGATETAEATTEEAAAEEIPNATFGDENGTHLEMWTFVELHGQHYKDMAEVWNEQNPDRTIEITCTTYPYGDMHTKLLTSLEAGTGAPDICDVEVGQFPNVVAGLDQWLVPLDDYASPYMSTMVPARMQTYQGEDGHYYGAPYHVGATAMYYNVAAMSEAMGLSQEEVIAKIDAVKTWSDYEALGKEYVDAIGEDGKYWTSVDTGGTDWLWLAMAEYGDDWTGGFENPANCQLDSVKNMLTMQQSWLKSGLAEISPDGHVDLEAGFQNIMDHNIVSFPKALWYMSRFTNYMPEMEGKYDITTIPVFEEGQKYSVGIGGTGTVVTEQSADPALAAEFLAWAKLSKEGESYIWSVLGFDVCNSALWFDDEFAFDESNQYNTFFRCKPYEVLQQIANDDAIGTIYSTKVSPTLNDYMCTTTLNEVFEDGMDIDEALAECQEYLEMELM